MTNLGVRTLVAVVLLAGLGVPSANSFADKVENPTTAVPETARDTASPAEAETVYLNMRSKKFHNGTCQFKKLCTKCVPSTRSNAKAQGLEACKVCGG